MPAQRNDKQIELERYDQRASHVLDADQVAALGPDGPEGTRNELRTPYTRYAALIRAHARPGAKVLDLCCGNGQHTLAAARLGAKVVAADIAPANVAVTLARAKLAGLSIDGIVCDAEQLPWGEPTFDLVTCAGSLSYADLDLFIGGVRRVLKPGGAFVFVDSLNHNPIYRLNRWLHYRRGRRSLSTLRRMPTLNTIKRIRVEFPDLLVSFHGIFSFLAPALGWADSARAARWLDTADHCLPCLHRYAFKIVAVGHKPLAR
jgi:2-polyprenyl-3-methyl-5-hydroxy-6-metoxy-1,4-benzoquinol methylase